MYNEYPWMNMLNVFISNQFTRFSLKICCLPIVKWILEKREIKPFWNCFTDIFWFLYSEMTHFHLFIEMQDKVNLSKSDFSNKKPKRNYSTKRAAVCICLQKKKKCCWPNRILCASIKLFISNVNSFTTWMTFCSPFPAGFISNKMSLFNVCVKCAIQ